MIAVGRHDTFQSLNITNRLAAISSFSRYSLDLRNYRRRRLINSIGRVIYDNGLLLDAVYV